MLKRYDLEIDKGVALMLTKEHGRYVLFEDVGRIAQQLFDLHLHLQGGLNYRKSPVEAELLYLLHKLGQ